MRKILIIAAVGSIALLNGCANQPANTVNTVNTVNTALYGAGKALATAQALALTYLSQAPCPAGKTALTCVDPAVKAKIKADSQAATSAYDAAVTANAVSGSAELTALAAATALLTADVPH